ncbi:sn-glycerol-3-phosphate ABC transporter ATP-binding protein UgpC [Devosia rhodophyticola]|uniref:Sn-glycerol-3-phosphate ABC transporter ATP-binding protein UgpC n=1 Tax=Devosia rhodophyticola TaxID=3026423 RepID=A0ABY7Z104_9HYPH|nr:sn-glycerol-3-phosphate ABC transporter ATP-binding protein UgpC [Devosia rhodophyticola]WDR06819.1 sn-glycerol-3-phosphate ABC transporter ATP-binding protein UgpC [Devosia rhodophyticola]
MSIIKLENARKSYGELEVLHGANLSVDDGEFCVFVGPSGCGKSTLLRMIAGLEEISDGNISIDGSVVNDVDPAERGVAMVFQSYALYPHMSVEQNMGFGLRMTGVPKPDIVRRVHEAAEILQIEELLARRPAQLSGGQRQRVAIGRAIVRNPKVFLFDEPLSNLDAELRVQMRVEIAKLHERLGNTMIYVTHDQTEAMTLADKIVVMRAGRIEQVGRPIDLYSDPNNIFVAGFLGSPKMNMLSAQLVRRNGTLQAELAGDISMPLPEISEFSGNDQQITIGIRPEHMERQEGNATTMELPVDVVEELGGTRYVYARGPSGEQVIVEQRGQRDPETKTVTARFLTDDIRVFDADGNRLR